MAERTQDRSTSQSKKSQPGGDFSFEPSARLQRYLGKELIADPNLAVIEFVKNSYDAGASRVWIQFALTASPASLRIADDGTGMDLASFQKNWMHPGFSSKSPDAPKGVTERPPSNVAGRRQGLRQQVGEKGLGRLSAARLGSVVDIYTRNGPNGPWLHVHIDWSAFDDMTRAMSDVKVPYKFVADLPESDLELARGTVVRIDDLDIDWARRLPGRPAFGRSRTRLGRLKQDLDLMLRPLDLEPADFSIDLQSDSVPEDGLLGQITPQTSAQVADYIMEFTFDRDGQGRPQVRRSLHRSAEIARQFDSKRKQVFKPERLEGFTPGDVRVPADLECGDFSGRFLYNPPPPNRRATAEEVIGHGVLVYRDGVIVEPYGLDANDWVGVEARKAQRQGHDLVQPATFWGEVLINRRNNPRLVDMANRQGLLENDASFEFISHVRAEFDFFERMVTAELEQRWEKPEESAAKTARSQLSAVTLMSRSFAHNIRQPLMGIGAGLVRLERVTDRSDLPNDVRRLLSGIHGDLKQHLERAERLVSSFAKTPEPEFEDTKVSDLLSSVETEVQPMANAAGVAVEFFPLKGKNILMPRSLVQAALEELIMNAIEAPRPETRAPSVEVRQQRDARDFVVEIEDNGQGLPGVRAGTPLGKIHLASTKGRQAEGIINVANVVAFARGEVSAISTDDEGTTILLRIPGRIAGLESSERGTD
jgi:signal transduction histidine kinase